MLSRKSKIKIQEMSDEMIEYAVNCYMRGDINPYNTPPNTPIIKDEYYETIFDEFKKRNREKKLNQLL